MSFERYEALVIDLCYELGMPDATPVLETAQLEYRSFEVLLNNYESDPSAIYLSFNFGVVLAGRSMRVYRLMLEANHAVYAQDQAQMGMECDSGSVMLIVRLLMVNDVSGEFLLRSMDHYVEHGIYWRETLMNSADDMFAGICSGDYRWIRV